MIQATTGKLHWNYFLALERDLEVVSRYVEFCQQNFDVYSIEFAHLLFAAASEVDVIAKLLCQRLSSQAPRANIDGEFRGHHNSGEFRNSWNSWVLSNYALKLTARPAIVARCIVSPAAPQLNAIR